MYYKKGITIEELKNILLKRIPYYSFLGFEIKEIKEGSAIFELEIRKELTQSGIVHGGVLASIVDSTCAISAYSLIQPQGFITTIDLQIQYLRPVSSGRLTAKAKCIKSGKTIFFCKSKVWDQEGRLICTGTSQLMRVNF